VATKRALVLGGGGVAGIAWQTGVLCGIADESPTAARLLLNSDVLVGTSAGSTVAAQSSDEHSLAAAGPNPLDPRRRVASAVAGRAQGRREAATMAAFLSV
jgi:predicted acylesterase/phospholipase RssA